MAIAMSMDMCVHMGIKGGGGVELKDREIHSGFFSVIASLQKSGL